eukprot:Gregarina_sp_Poly_1__5931@NODE_3122_length_1360_cov_19_294664_g1446_i1_p1_GENE_NODE_3122_length_1360_cov_19_294664_g1446_i1NODE_3122_length_1360_cov_19_294664_g1446_i1_p1_ORF_typecomplete_len309_score23_99_NODE_3122_length_1360_cov_19_294664_g1446_i14241350
MILAAECSSKNQRHTAIAAAITACFLRRCEKDGEWRLVESRPTHPDQLDRFDHPKYDGEPPWKDEDIPENWKRPFICSNEAIVKFLKNESFYELGRGESTKNFYCRMIPPLRALAANEEIIREFIKTAIDHFKKGTVAPPSFLEEASFQDLIHQYFKFSESKNNFLSKNDLLSKFGVATEKELFEVPNLSETTDELYEVPYMSESISQKSSAESTIWALRKTLALSESRKLKLMINGCILQFGHDLHGPSALVPDHIKMMQRSICNLLTSNSRKPKVDSYPKMISYPHLEPRRKGYVCVGYNLNSQRE